jgi:hypothetical protein
MRKGGLYLFILLSLGSCQKDFVFLTTEDKLADKTWYLEKISTPAGSLVYASQPTFSFHMNKSTKGYGDSDGMICNYEIDEYPAGSSLQLYSGGQSIRTFKIQQIEKNEFVIELVYNNQLVTYYFSTRL